MDRNHQFWLTGMPADLQAKRVQIFTGINSSRTFLPNSDNWGPTCDGWGGNSPLFNVDQDWSGGRAAWYAGYQSLASFVQQANQLGIKVAALVEPMSPAYANTPYYSRHGGFRADVDEFLDSVKSLENGNPSFRLLDFNHDGQHDFVDSEALNSDHLCDVGARRLTDSISARIQDWR